MKEKPPLKLRIILLVLSLLVLLSAASGGYLYYASLKESTFMEAESQAVARLEMIRTNLSSLLSEYRKSARTLAGMKEISQCLHKPDKGTVRDANNILDHFKDSLDAEVCYLVDGSGKTIASSNRNAPDSFVGHNYAFRPYFTEAIQNKPATYLALGTISNKRGAYYSHPVYGKKKGRPAGVVVIKASIQSIEKKLSLSPDEIVFVHDSRGIIFISNRKEWRYTSLKTLSAKETALVAASRQFGEGPWDWNGLTIVNDKFAKDRQGNEYLMNRTDIVDYPGWKVAHLRSLSSISRVVSAPLTKTTGPVVLALTILMGVSVFVLYGKAAGEISLRKSVEEALGIAKEELSRYSRDLEIQIKKRMREIDGILENIPAVVYTKDLEGGYLLVNSRYEALFGVNGHEIRGKTDFDVLPEETAVIIKHSDMIVLEKKQGCQFTENIRHEDGIHTYISVKFPLFDETGAINALCAILTDITALEKAQDQLRRLSGSIIESQEKERYAIARELHDELGQVLTALRMDSVWMHERLKETDERAAKRALAMCELVDKNIQDVRNMAIRLRPGVLDDLGLVDALEWHTSDFEKRSGIACIFEHFNVPALSETIATASYRIAQEALTNVARHAGASRVDVLLKCEKGILALAVADNGRGFNLSQIAESEGLGLAGMRERAVLAGGVLHVQSFPEKGATISFSVSLDEQSGDKKYDQGFDCG